MTLSRKHAGLNSCIDEAPDCDARSDDGAFHAPSVNQNFPCRATDCGAYHSAIKGCVPDAPREPECRGSHQQGDEASHVQFPFRTLGRIRSIKHRPRRQNIICVNRAKAALGHPRRPVGRFCTKPKADAWYCARRLYATPHTSATAGAGRRSRQHGHVGARVPRDADGPAEGRGDRAAARSGHRQATGAAPPPAPPRR